MIDPEITPPKPNHPDTKPEIDLPDKMPTENPVKKPQEVPERSPAERPAKEK